MNRRGTTSGFTLLEVILALAILGGAVGVIASAAWSGLENARMTRELVQAELLAESMMAELLAEVRPLETTSDASFEEDEGVEDPDQWLYSIDVAAAAVDGMLEVRVTVRAAADAPRKVEYSLVRWILDPDAIESEESE